MKGKFRNMILSVVTLASIAGASGLLLGLANKITYVDPEKEVMDKFANLSGITAEFENLGVNGDENVDYFAKSKEDVPTFALYVKGSGGYGGDVYIYVFVKENKITKICEGQHGETYFGVVEDKGYLNKFIGINIAESEPFSTDKADLVTGATKSSGAITRALNNAAEFYKKNSQNGGNYVDITLSGNYDNIIKVQKDDNLKKLKITASKSFSVSEEDNVMTATIIYDLETDKITSINANGFTDGYDPLVSLFVGKTKTQTEAISESDLNTSATASNSTLKEIVIAVFNMVSSEDL